MQNSLSKGIATGSIESVMRNTGKALARLIPECRALVVVDTSGSTDYKDRGREVSRIDLAEQEVRNIQAMYPGLVLVVSFSDRVSLNLNGIPERFFGSTNLTAALEYVIEKPIYVNMLQIPIWLLSDGECDDPIGAMRVAKRIEVPINTVFIGNPKDKAAIEFLESLAATHKGTSAVDASAAKLTEGMSKQLMLGSGSQGTIGL